MEPEIKSNTRARARGSNSNIIAENEGSLMARSATERAPRSLSFSVGFLPVRPLAFFPLSLSLSLPREAISLFVSRLPWNDRQLQSIYIEGGCLYAEIKARD